HGDPAPARRHRGEHRGRTDMGPLSESWRSQVGTPAFCVPYSVTKDDRYRNQPAAPATAAEIRAALASAQR
ncbi:hypothetical protein AB0I50_53545, partial [Streptomyces prunicolor]